jgi:2'-5' RNA ligase
VTALCCPIPSILARRHEDRTDHPTGSPSTDRWTRRPRATPLRRAGDWFLVGERRVTAVVVAALDERGDRAVERLLERVGARVPPRHRPHLTLGAARVPEAELGRVTDVAAAVAAAHAPFRLELASLGIFPQGVLWLAPRPEPALRDLQAGVDRALAAAGLERAFGAQADPDHWVAHLTLATGLEPAALGRAVTAVTGGFRPVRASVDGLATILVGRGDVAHARLGGSPP